MNFLGRKILRKNVPRVIATVVSGIVMIAFTVAFCSTMYGIHEVRGEIRQCEEAIALKESELKQLEQKKAYYESREFQEDSMRASGYVGTDETVFVVAD